MGAKGTKRRYSDDDRSSALAALAANGGDVAGTAARLEIPRKTLESWARGLRHPEAAQSCLEKKEPLAEAFDRIASRILGGVTDKKIRDANLQQTLTSAGIAVDKARLLRGEPTSIEENRDDERLRRLRERYGDPEGAAAGAAGDAVDPA